MTVTDDMVEKACVLYEHNDGNFPERMRAALEAVAPLLIAQGMREAAELCTEIKLIQPTDEWLSGCVDCSTAILARAQELDPK